MKIDISGNPLQHSLQLAQQGQYYVLSSFTFITLARFSHIYLISVRKKLVAPLLKGSE